MGSMLARPTKAKLALVGRYGNVRSTLATVPELLKRFHRIHKTERGQVFWAKG